MKNDRPKILIWDLNINIKNSGGPAGYLYNWKEYLKNTNEYDNIYFLKDLLGLENRTETKHSKYKKQLDFVAKVDVLKIWPCINVYRNYRNWIGETTVDVIKNIDLNQFDIIHFHIAFHLTKAIPLLKNFKGKIVLTTHSPEPLSQECVAGVPPTYSFLKNYLRKKMEIIELEAWKRADYMMFPVPSAIEPYCVSKIHKKYLLDNNDKLIYCPTSILNKEVTIDKNIFKEKCNIPDNAFIITYIGRHTEIKGYNQLLKLGESILDKYQNVYFVIGGLCALGQGLNHPRWIELGWINYGAQLIASSDLFILPNKETYFDIVALEVLRCGTPMMMSNTGGNKYFQQLRKNDGLRFFDYGDIKAQIGIIDEMLNMHIAKRNIMRESNIKLFESEFTMQSFFRRYETLMLKLLF